MDYQILANELLKYRVVDERLGKILQNSVTEIARGELAVLLYLIDEKNGACALDISQHFDINTSRVAAILNSLSKKQFIERQSDIIDKRKIHVYITELGKDYAMKHRNQITSHMAMMLERLGEDDAKEYLRIMKKVTQIMSEMEKELK